MWVPTYTPRPPVPMTPKDTAEFAWYPNAVSGFTIIIPLATPARAWRLLMAFMP